MDYELVYGLLGVAITAIVLGPLVTHMVKTHKRERALRRMTGEPLTDAEMLVLQAAADFDTHVIPQPSAKKAIGQVGGVAPELRRREIQPRRHRFASSAGIGAQEEARVIALLVESSSVGAKRARAALTAEDTAAIVARLASDRQNRR